MKTSLSNTLAIIVWFSMAACASSGPADETKKDVTAYVYTEECSDSVCPAAPTKAGAEVVECNKSNPSSKCDWQAGSAVSSNGSGVSSDPNSVVSFEACAEKECGPVPQIGCGAGFNLSVTCGKENGGKCKNYVTCSAKPTDVQCKDAMCGPIPELAQVCDQGESPVTRCQYHTDGQCRWNFGCEAVKK